MLSVSIGFNCRCGQGDLSVHDILLPAEVVHLPGAWIGEAHCRPVRGSRHHAPAGGASDDLSLEAIDGHGRWGTGAQPRRGTFEGAAGECITAPLALSGLG